MMKKFNGLRFSQIAIIAALTFACESKDEKPAAGGAPGAAAPAPSAPSAPAPVVPAPSEPIPDEPAADEPVAEDPESSEVDLDIYAGTYEVLNSNPMVQVQTTYLDSADNTSAQISLMQSPLIEVDPLIRGDYTNFNSNQLPMQKLELSIGFQNTNQENYFLFNPGSNKSILLESFDSQGVSKSGARQIGRTIPSSKVLKNLGCTQLVSHSMKVSVLGDGNRIEVVQTLDISYEDINEGACAAFFRLVQNFADDQGFEMGDEGYYTGYNIAKFESLQTIQYRYTKVLQKISNEILEFREEEDMGEDDDQGSDEPAEEDPTDEESVVEDPVADEPVADESEDDMPAAEGLYVSVIWTSDEDSTPSDRNAFDLDLIVRNGNSASWSDWENNHIWDNGNNQVTYMQDMEAYRNIEWAILTNPDAYTIGINSPAAQNFTGARAEIIISLNGRVIYESGEIEFSPDQLQEIVTIWVINGGEGSEVAEIRNTIEAVDYN